ncbi:MAG: hypothetical protein ABJL71_15240, partial [Cyclobacteriaceae bacterium]
MRKLSLILLGTLINLSVIVLVFGIQGCKEDSRKNNEIEPLIGSWVVLYSTLDDSLQSEWNNMFLLIDDLGNKEVSIKAENRPSRETQIWLDYSEMNLILFQKDSITQKLSFAFQRRDKLEVTFYESLPGSWDVRMHPHQEWSYDDECPSDSSQIF